MVWNFEKATTLKRFDRFTHYRIPPRFCVKNPEFYNVIKSIHAFGCYLWYTHKRNFFTFSLTDPTYIPCSNFISQTSRSEVTKLYIPDCSIPRTSHNMPHKQTARGLICRESMIIYCVYTLYMNVLCVLFFWICIGSHSLCQTYELWIYSSIYYIVKIQMLCRIRTVRECMFIDEKYTLTNKKFENVDQTWSINLCCQKNKES